MAIITTPRLILELLQCEGPLFTRQIAAKLSMSPRHICNVCLCLREKEYLACVEGLHGLTRKGLEAVSSGRFPCRAYDEKKGTLRQKAWNVMRMKDMFTVSDIMETVCDGTEKNAEGNIRQYCKALQRAGILKITQRTKSYFLPKGQGPLCPAYNRAENYVLDRNTGEIFRLGESL